MSDLVDCTEVRTNYSEHLLPYRSIMDPLPS